MTELQQTYSRTQQILTAFGSSDDALRIIYRPSDISPYHRVQTLRFYGFVTSLRMKVDIRASLKKLRERNVTIKRNYLLK
jgi:hypothetical protein